MFWKERGDSPYHVMAVMLEKDVCLPQMFYTSFVCFFVSLL